MTPHVPASYRNEVPAPLVLVLHGYGVSGAIQAAYFRISALSEAHGFVYLAPDGTPNEESKRFWSAAGACCDFYDDEVDDATYLRGLIDTAKQRFNIDDRRVFIVGHSNGGFMAYSMACEHSDQIAGIVSLAGAMHDIVSSCTPTEPVSVLQIHGTDDEIVNYMGGDSLVGWPASYPGAARSVQMWAEFNQCDVTADTGAEPLDLVPSAPGSETRIDSYPGCGSGSGVELWTLEGQPHIPGVQEDFADAWMEFLLAHPKP